MSEGLVLHGYQSGPDGFVQYGLGLNGEPPIDYLYLRALGGRQSGKSYGGGCRAAIYATTFPESSGMIVSLTTDKLRDTILPTMWNIFRTLGMKLDQDYSYNKTERAITFLRNGSIIYLRTAEEPQNLPGPSLSWFWLDEFRAMPEDVFLLLLPTLSRAGYPHQCWMTSTPAGKGHWSRKFWLPNAYAVDYGVEPTILKGATMRSYQAWTEDNPHLSPVYLEVLNGAYKVDSAMWRQETRGEEVLMEGMVYDQFNHRIHMQPKENWPSKPTLVLAGVDFGFRAPSAIIIGGIDKNRRHYLLDEFYRSGMEESDLAKQAKKLMNRYRIQYFICDNEDPGWIKAFRKAGLPAIPAKKVIGSRSDPSSGIGICYSLLSGLHPLGGPKIYINPSMVNFRREIENYIMEPDLGKINPTEKPRQRNNHAMDAWRYLETALNYYFGDTMIPKAGKLTLKN